MAESKYDKYVIRGAEITIPVFPEKALLNIGFDEKYLDRIFMPFQRLHGRFQYEGAGMGLAICRKILERHGGSITAKSVQGRGSTFIVTLPLKQATK